MTWKTFLLRTRLAYEEARAIAQRALTSDDPVSQPEVAQLEDRILLSASPGPVVVEGDAAKADAPSIDTTETVSIVSDNSDSIVAITESISDIAPSAEVRTATDALGLLDDIDQCIASSDEAGEPLANVSSESDAEAAEYLSVRHEVAFIDGRLPELEQLLDELQADADVNRDLQVVVISTNDDGLEVIRNTFAQQQDTLDAVHIFSHGTNGLILLGSTTLTQDNLGLQTEFFVDWRTSVAADADLMLYGCNVASAESGQAFVNQLSLLTGMDVAASVDATGHNALGGDWDLEYATGQIESSSALSNAFQDRWLTLLPTYEQFTNFTEDAELSSEAGWGQTFSHNSGLGQYAVNQISLVIRQAEDSTAEDVTVTLRSGLDSSIIATSTIAADNLSSTYAWAAFEFGDVQLVDNLSYTIEVTTSSANGGVSVGYAPDGYANGTLIRPDGTTVPDSDMAFVIGCVNHAPVLDIASRLTLPPQTIAAGSPAGSVGTLISALVDLGTPKGQLDNVTDVDTNPVVGIAVTAVDTAHGTWWYTTNGGANWLMLGPVSNDHAQLLAADASTRIYFQPNPGFGGTINSALTIRAWDQTSGANGGLADTTTNGGTTAFSTVTDTVSIYVNDAPMLDTSVGLTLDTIPEDATSNSGNTVAHILASAGTNPITDANNDAVGIAITSLNSGNGTWQYSLNGGSSWTSVGTVSTSAALLLRDTDRLRFVPDGLNGTNANFTFSAWDQTTALAGTQVSVLSNGGTTAFSTATATASIVVTSVNDAPVLNTTKSPALAGINENASAPVGAVGTLVSTLVDFANPAGQVDNITDVDTGALLGVAITAANTTNGTWYYSTDGGANWQALGAVSTSSARLLAADTNTRLYFQPNPLYNGAIADAITFRAWDQSSGMNGTLVDTTINGGTTAFSSATDTASLLVNDAPVLDNSANLTLATITEDETSNTGHTVAAILASAGTNPISDINTGAVEGLAITALNSGNGTWQYSLNGGTSWTSVGTVSNTSALLLRETDRIRFLPDAKNGTTASITFRAWDQATGAVGTKVSTASNGGTTAFSTATESASITVTSVNDAPVLNTTKSPALAGINEDAPAPVGAVGTLVSALVDFASPAGQVDNITDVDTGALLGIAITATNTTNGTWYYSTDGGANWQDLDEVSSNSARLLAADTNTRLYFQPNPDYNGTIADAITFRAWDKSSGTNGTLVDTSVNGGTTAFSTATDTASILVNDAPVLDNTANLTLATITEDEISNTGHTVAAILASAGTNPITDVNTGAVEGIAITTLNSGNGTWQYSLNNGSSWTSVGTVSNTSALLLRETDRVRFLPDAMNGTNASFTFCAWDQATGSAGTKVSTASNGGTTAFSTATESASILVTSVNDAPVLDTTKNPVLADVNEDASAPVGAVGTLVSNLVDFAKLTGQVDNIAEVDIGALLGIAVTATNTSNGTWYFSTDGGANWQTMGAVSTGSARLLAADANTRLYFQPTLNYNGTITDAITFRAWDQSSGLNGGLADTSANGGVSAFSTGMDSASLTVTPVNDAPVLTPYQPTYSSIEDGTVFVTSISSIMQNSVTDVDTNAARGIALTTVQGSGRRFSYSLDHGATWHDVSTVTASSALLLRAEDLLKFTPASANGGIITIDYRAWDQTTGTAGTQVNTTVSGGSTAFSATTDHGTIVIASVNDAPVLDVTKSPALTAQNEDAGAPSGSVGTLVSSLVSYASAAGQTYNVTDVDLNASLGMAITGADTTHGTWYYSTDGGSNWNALGAVSDASARLLAADANTRVYFQSNPNYGGTVAAALTFRAWDRTSGTNGSVASTINNGGTTAFSSATDTASLVINSLFDDAPVITSGGGGTTADLTVAENTTSITTITATDVDVPAQTLSYVILGGQDMALFSINASSGVLTFVSGRDREHPTDGNFDGVYEVTVGASDGIFTDSQTLRITVTDVDEFNTSDVSDANDAPNTVAENATAGSIVGLTGLANDADATTNTITYSLDNNAGGRFAVDANTGVVTVNGALDYETSKSHQLVIRATSADGSTASQTFTVQVTNVNEVPIAVDDQYFLGRGETLTATPTGVLANDQDTDNDPVTAVLQTNVTHGTLILLPDGTFTYQPAPSFYGIDQFTYLITDGSLVSQTVTVTLVVDDSLPTNDGGIQDMEEVVDNSSDSDTSIDDAAVVDEPNSVMQEVTDSDSADMNRDEVAVAELAVDLQAIMRRTYGGPTLEQEMEAAWTNTERSLNQSTTQLASLTSLQRTRGSLYTGMTSTPHAEGLAFAAGSSGFVFSTLPLALESSSLPVQQVEHAQGLSPESLVLGTSAVVSSALTVGYVTWLLRGGSLVASFLASLPAWAAFDPLPVLISGAKQDETTEEDDRLVDLVRDGAKPTANRNAIA